MSALFKYVAFCVAFLLLALAISPDFLEWLSPENVASAPAKPEAAAAPVDPAGTAAIDEELDYWAAQKVESLDGWRSFLAAHGSGVHAKSAKAALDLLLAEKANARVTAEVAVGATLDEQAASQAAPSAETAAASIASDEICKRDEDRLARLRSRPSIDEAARFAGELACQRLWPQLLGMIEKMGSTPPAPTDEAANGLPADAQLASETAPSPPPASRAGVGALAASATISEAKGSPANTAAASGASPAPSTTKVAAPSPTEVATRSPYADAKAAIEATLRARPSPATQVAFLTPDDCKRDADRLTRLRRSPSGEKAQRFASEIGCDRLRPQLLRLMESLGYSAPAAVAPSPSPASSSVSGAQAAKDCATERDALDRLRAQPSAETAQQFWRNLHCERLRSQVRLLLESLDLAADPSGACRREAEELNRIRANPNDEEAKRFARTLTCDALKPQAARLLESLVSSPDADSVSETVHPAPSSKGTEVAPLTASAPAVASPDAKAASKTVHPAAPSLATEATAPAPTAEAKDDSSAEANPASESPGTVFAGRYEDGAAAYNRGEFAKAKRVWLPLAEQGDARAQTGLCILYFLGQGTQVNIAAALEWCGRGADQGLAAAQYELGQIYEHPWRPELQNFAEALKWYNRAADQGNAKAQDAIGGMYEFGMGLPRSYAEAEKWFSRAGDIYSIAKMYDDVAKNPQVAATWYRKLADQGDQYAKFRLGELYRNGEADLQSQTAASGHPKNATKSPEAPLRGRLSRTRSPQCSDC